MAPRALALEAAAVPSFTIQLQRRSSDVEGGEIQDLPELQLLTRSPGKLNFFGKVLEVQTPPGSPSNHLQPSVPSGSDETLTELSIQVGGSHNRAQRAPVRAQSEANDDPLRLTLDIPPSHRPAATRAPESSPQTLQTLREPVTNAATSQEKRPFAAVVDALPPSPKRARIAGPDPLDSSAKAPPQQPQSSSNSARKSVSATDIQQLRSTHYAGWDALDAFLDEQDRFIEVALRAASSSGAHTNIDLLQAERFLIFYYRSLKTPGLQGASAARRLIQQLKSVRDSRGLSQLGIPKPHYGGRMWDNTIVSLYSRNNPDKPIPSGSDLSNAKAPARTSDDRVKQLGVSKPDYGKDSASRPVASSSSNHFSGGQPARHSEQLLELQGNAAQAPVSVDVGGNPSISTVPHRSHSTQSTSAASSGQKSKRVLDTGAQSSPRSAKRARTSSVLDQFAEDQEDLLKASLLPHNVRRRHKGRLEETVEAERHIIDQFRRLEVKDAADAERRVRELRSATRPSSLTNLGIERPGHINEDDWEMAIHSINMRYRFYINEGTYAEDMKKIKQERVRSSSTAGAAKLFW